MKLLIFLFIPFLSFGQGVFLDSNEVSKILPHPIDEYVIKSNAKDWENVAFSVGFGNSNQAYFSNDVPVNISSKAFKSAWKGERINFLLLLWSKNGAQQVRITNKISQNKGIENKHFRYNLVKNILSNYPYNARGFDCGGGPTDKAYLIPDRLEEFTRFDLDSMRTQAVLITLDIPQNANPGVFKGQFEIKTTTEIKTLEYEINIQNQVLPQPENWKFRLDLWQNPFVIAKYFKVKPWSEEHKILLKKHLELYANAGGKYITTYSVHSPWQDITYYVDESMINWVKLKNGKWKFDYTIFDTYVNLCMQVGINKAITIYTPLPWGERFRYEDEVSGNLITERWLPNSVEFKTNWNAFLTDLAIHLKQKGWFEKTYIGINENAMEQTMEAIKLVKTHNKNWKITYAGDWHQELNKYLDDFSFVKEKEANVEIVDERHKNGQTTTFYVCCVPAKPNNFVFSPPVEGRWLGLYALAHNYDGFLRWAFESWLSDPTKDARHVSWGAGDSFLVYPGGNSSVRYEKLREGIVDYEKMKILEQLVEKSNNPEAKKQLILLKQSLKNLIPEKDFDSNKLEKDLQNFQEKIDAISLLLK